jgi:hypothetical protein
MLTYAVTAHIAGVPGKAAAWAQEMAALITARTGAPVNVSARVGGPREIILISQYHDFAAFQKAQAVLNADDAYGALMQSAADAALFDPLSVDTAFWEPI